MARGLRPGQMLQKDLVQPGTWIPLLKAGTRLSSELIAKIRRLGLEGIALDCAGFQRREVKPLQRFLHEDEVESLRELASGQGNPHELRSLVLQLAQRLQALRQAPDFRISGAYDMTHSINVFMLSLVVGHDLDYGPTQLLSLGAGALLHDIGKAALPERVLHKPGPLELPEQELVRHHPMLGIALLGRSQHFSRWLLGRDSLEAVRYHHERFDGSGYPEGLKGRQIPVAARIVAVADAFDAMVSDRPHAARKSPGEAYVTLKNLAGSHFDPTIVEAFTRRVLPYPTGSEVYLSDGRLAKVLRASRDRPLRPLVEVDGEELDLERQRDVIVADLRIDRHRERIGVSLPVRVCPEGGQPVWGRCLNLSADGACLEIPGGGRPFARLELQFCTRGMPAAPVRGTVCWTHVLPSGACQIGIHVEHGNLLTHVVDTAQVS